MKALQKIDPYDFESIVFFTGAGMSAESGVPVYRGEGGVWEQYQWQEYACQRAFERNPEKVLEFHELRRAAVLKCRPHRGHEIIAKLQRRHPDTHIVTQNIDGMHQRAGSEDVVELHGSLWRVRCPEHGVSEDYGEQYKTRRCPRCGHWLRPDITWFEDILDMTVLQVTEELVKRAKLFVCIGTSGVVYPAAAFPVLARQMGATTVCINTEPPLDKDIFDIIIREKAGNALGNIFLH